jgi:hypothetical protein
MGTDGAWHGRKPSATEIRGLRVPCRPDKFLVEDEWVNPLFGGYCVGLPTGKGDVETNTRAGAG